MTPGLGANVSGILGVDAALDRVAAELDVALPERQPLAGRDPDLFLDDVDAGDELGDRMLDLQPRVRFEEVEVPRRVHQELERARRSCTARRAPLRRPSRPSRRRCFSVSATDGASSISF